MSCHTGEHLTLVAAATRAADAAVAVVSNPMVQAIDQAVCCRPAPLQVLPWTKLPCQRSSPHFETLTATPGTYVTINATGHRAGLRPSAAVPGG